MPINILMPALSPTMEKGNLAKWLVKEGDKVKSGDVIAEIETDKATMEVEAVDEGRSRRSSCRKAPQDVPVNDVIAVLAGEGEDAKAAGPRQRAAAEAPQRRSPTAAKAGKPRGSSDRGCGRAGRGTSAAAAQRPALQTNGHGGRIFSSPLARAAGEGSRHRDRAHHRVRTARAHRRSATSRRPSPARAEDARGRRPPALRLSITDGWRTSKSARCSSRAATRSCRTTGCGRIIAQRLVEAKTTVPHFYLTIDCRIDKLLAARAEINAAAPKDKDEKPLYKLSVNDMVIKAMAMALRGYPKRTSAGPTAGC